MKYLFLLLFPVLSFANYLSIGESGEVIQPNTYRVGGSFQTTSAGKGGVNVGAFLDSGWTDDMSSRFLFGVGAVEFQMGATLKYIPFPDVGQQPALGIRSAIWLSRIDDTSVTTLQFAPMASKKINVDRGRFTSYFAVPVNLVFLKNTNTTGTQFTIGAEYEHPDAPDVFFSGEIFLNLNKSDSGLGLFVCIPFDNTSGFKRRAK
jgi:hypothetical protein